MGRDVLLILNKVLKQEVIVLILFIESSVQDAFEREREKLEALSGVKFVLELHPVQSEGVEKRGEPLHDEENGHREDSEEEEHDGEQNEAKKTSAGETDVHHHGPQHLRQLCVCQTESP